MTPRVQSISENGLSLISPDRLPKRPYCTNDLSYGIRPRDYQQAIKLPYIQLNPPGIVSWLIFDIDRAGAAYAWEQANLPHPNLIAVNPENGHAHLYYALETPVITTPNGKDHPIRYLAAIQRAYTELLQADANYSGLIAKNPRVAMWRVLVGAANTWSLGELAEWVDDLNAYRKIPNSSEAIGLGRNCYLFEMLRVWAYNAIRRYREATKEAFMSAVAHKAEQMNSEFFPNRLLPKSEVLSIAKSVARFCLKHDGRAQAVFRARQAKRSKKASDLRSERAKERKAKAIEMRARGMTNAEIAKALGVTDRTVRGWKLPKIR